MNDEIFDKNIKNIMASAGSRQSIPEDKKEQILDTLLNSAAQTPQKTKTITAWKLIIKHPAVKLAAAAAVIIAVGLLLVHPGPDERQNPKPVINQQELSPTSMLAMSLAFRKGGLPALEEQCDKAYQAVSDRVSEITISQMFHELNNNKNGRI